MHALALARLGKVGPCEASLDLDSGHPGGERSRAGFRLPGPHFLPGARGYYAQGGFCGTREGGPFEIVINALVEIDDHGLIARVDTYDDDRVFSASRWSELGIPVAATARESAALAPFEE